MRGKCMILLAITALTVIFGGCGSDDSYRDTLSSGLEKYHSGDNMTRSEYNAVKSFNNWKADQGSKSYSDWDN